MILPYSDKGIEFILTFGLSSEKERWYKTEKNDKIIGIHFFPRERLIPEKIALELRTTIIKLLIVWSHFIMNV